jgi:hypothetical protein
MGDIMSKIQGPIFPSFINPPQAAPKPIIQTHHALNRGESWISHEKPHGKAAHRRLKQRARDERNRLRKQYGSSVVSAQDPDGALILDFPEPARATK